MARDLSPPPSVLGASKWAAPIAAVIGVIIAGVVVIGYGKPHPHAFDLALLLRQPPVILGHLGAALLAVGLGAVQFLAPYSITIREEPARNVAVYDHGGGGVSRTRNVPNAFQGSPRGQIFGVESLPGLFVRARCDTPLAERSTMMTCFGVEASDWQDRQEVAPRTTLALAAGRYAVIDGRGSFAALYRAWRRGFDAWLINNGECPRADRLFARFHSGLPSGLLDPARITLYVPLEPLAIETSGRRNGKRGAAPKTQAVVQLQASV